MKDKKHPPNFTIEKHQPQNATANRMRENNLKMKIAAKKRMDGIK